jgi:predicted RNase H-like HicB family nuclease
MSHVKVTAFWDSEADVWVAESADVPGLVMEADSLPQLADELKEMIPELMRANGIAVKGEIAFDIEARYHGVAHALEA